MTVLGVLNQINGRDKTARFFQYLCRLLDYITARNTASDRYKFLEYQLGTFRKLLRFGRSLESFYLASKNIHNADVLSRLAGLAKIAHGCYLFCDHFLLMKRLQLLQLNSNAWASSANKYWLLAIILNLIHNYYELKKVWRVYKKNNNDSLSILSHVQIYFSLYVDLIRNCCDIFIPLYALNYVQLSSGLIGLFGMLSSIAGLITLIANQK
ncbi:peroxisomal membrane protein 11A [Halyomorpha halys]|uniref:peroxisomal membrane protein 11A n=1 Tax=Halyomorpha halys TaxID=286706 RepID=UPI0006D4F346|nr:peroxisomal membrane protein 11A [Halyomorpha halys]